VRKPVMSHTAISNPGEPTCLAISALTMKIPDPIIDPTTMAVESNRFRLFLKECSLVINNN
jgi:hypothetical protein